MRFVVWLVLFFSFQLKANPSVKSLQCVSGNCFLRKAGSAVIKPVPLGDFRNIKLGDVVISVGHGSRIEISFEDQSKIYLRDNGLYKVGKVDKDLLFAHDSETESSEKHFDPEDDVRGKGNLIYIGELPLKFLTPKFDEKFIFSSFPQSMRVVFEVSDSQKDSSKLEALESWQLLSLEKGPSASVDSSTAKEIGIVKFETQSRAGGVLHYAADLTIPHEGHYRMLPLSEYKKGSTSGVRLQIGGRAALKQSIRTLLEGAAENPDAGIEVRE